MKFKNRIDAAKKLLPYLEKYRHNKGVILAVPRGAVPIADYLATELGFPMEPLLIKKIGHPFNPELAIGAVSLESAIIDPGFEIDKEYTDKQIQNIRKALKERYAKFMGDRLPIDLEGKIVIIVDDGVATGNTMLSSVELVRHKKPAKVIVAVPVASPQAANKIRAKVDELICPLIPESFMAVGQFYEDFSEVTDKETIEILKKHNHHFNIL